MTTQEIIDARQAALDEARFCARMAEESEKMGYTKLVKAWEEKCGDAMLRVVEMDYQLEG